MEKYLKRKEPSTEPPLPVNPKKVKREDVVFVVEKLEEEDDYKRRNGAISEILGVFRKETDAKLLIMTTKKEFIVEQMESSFDFKSFDEEDKEIAKMLEWDGEEATGIKEEFQEKEDAIEKLFDWFNQGEFAPYKMEIFFTKHIVN